MTNANTIEVCIDTAKGRNGGRWRAASALAGALLLTARPALAQVPDRVLPSRDVQVTYQVSGAAADAIPALAAGDGQPAVLHLTWDASGERLRVSAEGRPEVAIVDLRQHRADIEEPALHTMVSLSMRAADVQALNLSHAGFRRGGHGSVLGYGCTVWNVREARGSGNICLTDDGVALRGDGEVNGRQGSFLALSVAYGPQPAGLFSIPPGYNRLDLSRLKFGN